MGTRLLWIVWGIALAFGVRAIVRYETTAGAQNAIAQWPSKSQLPRAAGFTLVMFLHPDCPCSRASLSELAVIADRTHVAIDIVFERSGGEMWERAGRIPNAHVIADAHEAARFGAKTSGQVELFDASGALRFAGGITGSRGHAGDNVGRDSVLRVLAGQATPSRHAVFGCALEKS